MSLSPETVRELRHAHEKESKYLPNADIQRELGSRSLLMIVAPAAMGKTYLMQTVAERDERFGLSSTLSTRIARSDDVPGQFRLVPHDDEHLQEVLGLVKRKELVQYAVHPTELTFYGSELVDHPHEYNMLATLSSAIEQLQEVGFRDTTVIGLVAPPTDWNKWFSSRYPSGHPKRLNRLKEAELSYRNLLARDNVQWIINRDNEIESTAASAIRAVEGSLQSQDEARAYAQRIRQIVADVSRLEQVEASDA